MSIQPPGYVIQPGDHVETITHPRARPGSVRVWADASRAALLAATCTACGTLTPVAALVRHAAKPGGYRLNCRQCHTAACAAYHTANREARRTYRRAYNAANREARRAYNRAYSTTPERKAAQAARDHAKRDRYAARTTEQVLADRARLRPDGLKRCRRCHEALPFEAFYGDSNRPDGLGWTCRACDSLGLMRIALPRIEAMDVWICTYCGAAPIGHIDHVHPRSRGGQDTPANLVGSCPTCNTSKGARDPFEWRPDLLALVKGWPCVVRPLPG